MTSSWAQRRLKSPASPLFAQSFVQADQRKPQSSASLAFVRGIHRWLGDSLTKASIAEKFLFDDVITDWGCLTCNALLAHATCQIIYLNCEQVHTLCVGTTFTNLIEGNFSSPMCTRISSVWHKLYQFDGCKRISAYLIHFISNSHIDVRQWPLLLTWFNFNRSMDKWLHPL